MIYNEETDEKILEKLDINEWLKYKNEKISDIILIR